VSIQGRLINKNVEAYLEITRRRSGDMLDFYIKVNESTWYYFGYTPGVLQVLSSNKNFNEPLLEIKADKRHIKGVNGETPYDYSVASTDRKNKFLKRWEANNKGEISSTPNDEDSDSDSKKKKKKK